jgi:outer membrane biosynthesis protein TonB
MTALNLPAAHAQSAPCGLTSMRETKTLNYPQLMKLAQVQGVVVLLATFDRDGNVTQIEPISGPGMFKGAFAMLRDAAMEFVQGWHANPFTGPRECPVAINFILGQENEKPHTTITRVDLQHVQITVERYPPEPSYSAMKAK